MKNLLEFLLLHLVDHPEDIVIDEIEEATQTRFVIHVHPEDMGKVIGKRGAVIDAIRKIARVRAVKEGIRAYVSVAEAGEMSPVQSAPEVETTAQDDGTADDTSDEQFSQTDDNANTAAGAAIPTEGDLETAAEEGSEAAQPQSADDFAGTPRG